MDQPEPATSEDFNKQRKNYLILWGCGFGLFVLGLLIKNMNEAYAKSQGVDPSQALYLVHSLIVLAAHSWMVVVTTGFAIKTHMRKVWAYLLGVLALFPTWWIISLIILMCRKPRIGEQSGETSADTKPKGGIGKTISLVFGILLIAFLLVGIFVAPPLIPYLVEERAKANLTQLASAVEAYRAAQDPPVLPRSLSD